MATAEQLRGWHGCRGMAWHGMAWLLKDCTWQAVCNDVPAVRGLTCTQVRSACVHRCTPTFPEPALSRAYRKPICTCRACTAAQWLPAAIGTAELLVTQGGAGSAQAQQQR